MPYRLLDERPVTLGAGGLTVWTEAGWPLTIRSKQLYHTVVDDQGRVYLLNHTWRLRILRRFTGYDKLGYVRSEYFLAMSRKGPLLMVKPMLRLKSVLDALR